MKRSGSEVGLASSGLTGGRAAEVETEEGVEPHRGEPFGGSGIEAIASWTILLVEDEAFVRDVVDEILSCAGYRVLKARSADEALRIFHSYQGKIELLITDVVLPDRNGCDLASEFSLLCRGVRTIFISGYPESVLIRKGLRRSRRFYLSKPFSGQTLIKKVREVLQTGPR